MFLINHHIRTISEGLCETEDCVKMLKIQLCHHKNKLNLKYIKIENLLFWIVIIFHNITVLLYFDCIETLSKTFLKNLTDAKFLNSIDNIIPI